MLPARSRLLYVEVTCLAILHQDVHTDCFGLLRCRGRPAALCGNLYYFNVVRADDQFTEQSQGLPIAKYMDAKVLQCCGVENR